MSDAGPSRLTSALLARKGEAVPAAFTAPGPFAHIPAAAGEAFELGTADQTLDARPTAVPARRRVTLRARPDLHLKIKISAQHLHRSMNDLLTEAVTRYLDQLGPEVLSNDWVRVTLHDGRSTS